MNIMTLPGVNPKTERWAINLLKELEAPGRTLQVQRYKHRDCEDADQCLDVNGEVERLKECAIDLLIAKSLGVMIGLQACSKKMIFPALKKCPFAFTTDGTLAFW